MYRSRLPWLVPLMVYFAIGCRNRAKLLAKFVRCNEVSLYRGSFSCISILGCKGNRSFYQGLRYIEVRSSKFPAVFAPGVFLGILSKGVPPGSPLSYFRPNNVIFHSRFQTVWPLKSILRPGLLEIMSSLLRLEQQQKRFVKIQFEFE